MSWYPRPPIVFLLLVALLALPAEPYGGKSGVAGMPRLVLHYRFSEPGGWKALDSSSIRNHAVLVGGVRHSSGKAMLNGFSGHLVAPSHPALNSVRDGVTVSAWVFRTAVAPSGYRGIVGRRFGPAHEDLWVLFYNTSARAEYSFGVRTINGPAYVYGPSSNTDVGAWTHLVGVYDGSTVGLYKNGVRIAAARHTGAIPAQQTPVVVGAGDNGTRGVSEFFGGYLDDVRIYDRALNPQEIHGVMQTERPAGAPGGGGPVDQGSASVRTLRVHPVNPRYFTDGSEKAVYLTGSHTWNNLVDGGGADSEALPNLSFEAYLDVLQSYRHNFIRMWTREGGSRFDTQGKTPLYRLNPTIWRRAGAGKARDGDAKFDLDQLNPAYFARLRHRVAEARRRGFYVGVMLFEGFSVEDKGVPDNGDPWPGHPFHRDNNVSGVDGDLNGDGKGREVHTLEVAEITRYQAAYVRRVIDTVNDLDNVIYEVCNECTGGVANARWQDYIVSLIREYEATKPQQHPVWVTVPWPRGQDRMNGRLLAGKADAISPGSDEDQSRLPRDDYRSDPPASDGTKVVLPDTDHLWGMGGSLEWVWKCFTRGLNPIFMDPLAALTRNPKYSDVAGAHAIRSAMGHSRRYAERMDLVRMLPQSTECSTGYCLAKTGAEYLVYQPAPGKNFSVSLPAAEYVYEWFDPITGTVRSRGSILSAGTKQSFTAPWKGQAVLYLKAS